MGQKRGSRRGFIPSGVARRNREVRCAGGLDDILIAVVIVAVIVAATLELHRTVALQFRLLQVMAYQLSRHFSEEGHSTRMHSHLVRHHQDAHAPLGFSKYSTGDALSALDAEVVLARRPFITL